MAGFVDGHERDHVDGGCQLRHQNTRGDDDTISLFTSVNMNMTVEVNSGSMFYR